MDVPPVQPPNKATPASGDRQSTAGGDLPFSAGQRFFARVIRSVGSGQAVLDLAPALVVKGIVDAASAGAAGTDAGARARIDVLFLVLIGSVLASGLLGVALGYVNQSIGQGVMRRMKTALA